MVPIYVKRQYVMLFQTLDVKFIYGSSYFNLLYYFGRLMMNFSITERSLQLYTNIYLIHTHIHQNDMFRF